MNLRLPTLTAVVCLLSAQTFAKPKDAPKTASPKTTAKSATKAAKTTKPAAPVRPTTGKITDTRDGKSYKTVVVGSQTWMAQNLNFTVTGSACYENKKQSCEELGRLYDWEMAKSACPAGWHLPTEDEWDLLEQAAGGDSAGYHLKTASGWENQGNGSNSRGFDAIPSGDLSKTGLYLHRGVGATYWTASSKFGGGAWFRSIDFFDTKLMHDNAEKTAGFSVRCVKGGN